MNVKESEIKDLLLKYKKLTVIGLSPDSSKPSHRVPLFLKTKGYDPVGIYPNTDNIAGMHIYNSLNDVPVEHRKFVDVFRKPEYISGIVDEIIKLGGVEVLWLQLGITNPEAEARAEKAGIKVVSNRCLHIEYVKYLGSQNE